MLQIVLAHLQALVDGVSLAGDNFGEELADIAEHDFVPERSKLYTHGLGRGILQILHLIDLLLIGRVPCRLESCLRYRPVFQLQHLDIGDRVEGEDEEGRILEIFNLIIDDPDVQVEPER